MFKPEVQAGMLALAKQAAEVTFGAAVLRYLRRVADRDGGMDARGRRYRSRSSHCDPHIRGGNRQPHSHRCRAVEVLFLPMVGARSWGPIAWGYLLPTLIGNIIGGTSLTASVNHAQVVAGMSEKRSAAPSNDGPGHELRSVTKSTIACRARCAAESGRPAIMERAFSVNACARSYTRGTVPWCSSI
jgi:hypothetical protein